LINVQLCLITTDNQDLSGVHCLWSKLQLRRWAWWWHDGNRWWWRCWVCVYAVQTLSSFHTTAVWQMFIMFHCPVLIQHKIFLGFWLAYCWLWCLSFLV